MGKSKQNGKIERIKKRKRDKDIINEAIKDWQPGHPDPTPGDEKIWSFWRSNKKRKIMDWHRTGV